MNEACWLICNVPIYEQHPLVIHLSVHSENGQRVYFTEENVLKHVQAAYKTSQTEGGGGGTFAWKTVEPKF
jgi:hypothetical protein